MDHYAIVIGIDKYPLSGGKYLPLTGSTAVATCFAEWLLRKGSVRPENLRLLLSPVPANPRPFGPEFDVVAVEATVDQILGASQDINSDRATKGARLYFYFVGHGHEGGLDEIYDAIAPANYNGNSVLSIRVDKITRLFKSGHFAEVFLILDCCRNRTGDTEFQGVPGIGAENSAVEIFDCRATSRNRVSFGGVDSFSNVLLKGLKGDGRAVSLDRKNDRYLIRYGKLREYVRTVFTKLQKQKSADPLDSRYQQPNFREGRDDACLAAVSPDEVGKLRLDVVLAPKGAAPASQVRVLVQETKPPLDCKDHNPDPPPPVRFELRPGWYIIQVIAHQFKKDSIPVDLSDDDQEVSFTLEPEPSQAPVRPAPRLPNSPKGTGGLLMPRGGSPHSERGHRLRIVGNVLFRKIAMSRGLVQAREEGKNETANLIIETPNELSTIEVFDESGGRLAPKRVASRPGVGGRRSEFLGLEPGIYKACLLPPEGRRLEKLVSLGVSEQKTITLEAPAGTESPLTREIIRALGPQVRVANHMAIDERGVISGASTPSLLSVICQSAAPNRTSAAHWWESGSRTWGWKRFLV